MGATLKSVAVVAATLLLFLGLARAQEKPVAVPVLGAAVMPNFDPVVARRAAYLREYRARLKDARLEPARVKYDDLDRMSQEAHLPPGQTISGVDLRADEFLRRAGPTWGGWCISVTRDTRRFVLDAATIQGVQEMMRRRGAKLPVHVISGWGPLWHRVLSERRRALPVYEAQSYPKGVQARDDRDSPREP
jgi:hypothetical protein